MRAIVLSLSLAACGSIGGSGGGADHLPVSGGGPFGPLPSLPGDLIDAPVALTDPGVDLDHPFVVANGEALTVWVTAHRAGGDTIERADARSIRKGFGELERALSADQPWEGGGVSAPSVVMGDPSILFYAGAGGIGAATSTDGHTWSKLPGPLIPGVGPPAAVRIGDQLRVYYLKDGSIFAAEESVDHFTELGEMVHGVPYGQALGRAFARSATTPAGRMRHNLYFTVAVESTMSESTCGFAASYDSLHFDVYASPITDARQTTSGCTMAPYQSDGVDSALGLWIQRRGARAVVIAGKSP